MKAFKEKWQTLAPRERLFVSVGGTIVIILLIYYFLISPFVDNVTNLRQQVRENRGKLQWVQVTQALTQKFKATELQPVIVNQSVAMIINSTVQTNGLRGFNATTQTINPQTSRIVFDSVPFDALIHWLTLLWTQYNIQVINITVSATVNPGLVQANMVVARS